MEKIIEDIKQFGELTINNNDIPYVLMELKYYCAKQNISAREFITTQTVPEGEYYMGSLTPIEFTFAIQGLMIDNIPYILQPTIDGKTIISKLSTLGYKY